MVLTSKLDDIIDDIIGDAEEAGFKLTKKDEECPICKGKITKEIRQYVLDELEKMTKDPTYRPVSWSKRNE